MALLEVKNTVTSKIKGFVEDNYHVEALATANIGMAGVEIFTQGSMMSKEAFMGVLGIATLNVIVLAAYTVINRLENLAH